VTKTAMTTIALATAALCACAGIGQPAGNGGKTSSIPEVQKLTLAKGDAPLTDYASTLGYDPPHGPDGPR
jgi:hypothetical protein